MPYENRRFDSVMSMLALHEMAQQTRLGALSEMKRVLKEDGHILLIDFHPGPYQPMQGWISKVIIFFSEVAAGREHYRNHRQFLAAKGLAPLASLCQLEVEKQSILAGGTLAVLLAGGRKT